MTHHLASPSRRAMLGGAGALCAWNFMPRFAHAAGGRDPRFVVIILRGALDGLTAVPPIGDPSYRELRQSIALTMDGPHPALRLDGFFALDPVDAEPCPALSRPAGRDRACLRHGLSRPLAFRRPGRPGIGLPVARDTWSPAGSIACC